MGGVNVSKPQLLFRGPRLWASSNAPRWDPPLSFAIPRLVISLTAFTFPALPDWSVSPLHGAIPV